MSRVMQMTHMIKVMHAISSTPATRLIKVMRKRARIARARVERSCMPLAATR